MYSINTEILKQLFDHSHIKKLDFYYNKILLDK